jgi:WD40 repeat protein
MLLLGSDCPGLLQLAVLLASGTLLFYDLATYCMPGAAWQPSCCRVGCGHIGAVTTHLEVLFRCPPQDLIACTGAAEAAAAASQDVMRQPLSRTHSSSSSHGLASAAAAAHASEQHHSQQQPQQAGSSPCRSRDWSCRPVGGGAVPLLLTGGSDGSVRGWDLRVSSLGQPWMAVHPHTGRTKCCSMGGRIVEPLRCLLQLLCCVHPHTVAP